MYDRERPSAAATLFTVLGLAQAIFPPFVDVWISVTPSGGSGGGHVHGGGGFSLFLPMSITGVAFVAFAQAASKPGLFASRAGRSSYLIFLLLLFDGVLHLFALAPDVGELPRVAFLSVVGPLEIGGALWFIRRPGASVKPWLVLDVGLVLLYLLGLSVPLWGGLQALGPLGLTSTAAEAVLLVPFLGFLRPTPPPGEATAAPGTVLRAPGEGSGRSQARCPYCKAIVREGRLPAHVRSVHPSRRGGPASSGRP